MVEEYRVFVDILSVYPSEDICVKVMCYFFFYAYFSNILWWNLFRGHLLDVAANQGHGQNYTLTLVF